MCGIAGIISFNDKIQAEALKRMTDVISHRGPDGEGHWLNPSNNVGLGHRRLSIIDLSDNGKQPMHFGGRYTITFNGEIYNYIELREQLKLKGYQFTSSSDTEVLLALYDDRKEKCLNDLDGMFAFAIWDEKEKELFCARDRFGEKPFHYYSDVNRFVFASEIKQFWTLGIEKKMSEPRLKDFLLNGKIDGADVQDSTFYEGIKRLDAAHYLRIGLNGKTTLKRYWEINLDAKTFTGSLESAAAEFLHLLTESVRLRLRSDVPVGSSLSGGLDSSSLVMLIDALKGKELKQNTFSARFKNFAKDEGKYIEQVVKACKNIEVHYTWPDEEYFLKVFDKVTYHQDEPYGSASIIAQYAVMELAKKNNVTVLLDGQAADEYMGGYLSQFSTYLNQLFYHNKSIYSSEYEAYSAFHLEAAPVNNLGVNESLRMKLGRYKRIALKQSMPTAPRALAEQLKYDTQTNGLKTLLRYADRNSMAHSREVRLPFTSHQLVEFVFSLPDNYKLNKGWTKFILRKSMTGILPDSICWRTDKIGYEPPQRNWLDTPVLNEEINKASALFKMPLLENKKESLNASQKWKLLMASKYL